MKASKCIGFASLLALSALGAASAQPRIADTNVPNGKYPFMVTVQVNRSSGEAPLNAHYYDHYCSGTLISQRQVLTYAHCLDTGDPDDTNRNFEEFTVIAGRTVLTDKTQGVKAEVNSVYVHPKFFADGGDYNYNYDVAILELKTPIQGIKPIAVVSSGTDVLDSPGAQLTSVSWFRSSALHDRLQEDQTSATSYAECALAYQPYASRGTGFFPAQGLRNCVRFIDPASCQGDAGDPLLVALPGNDNFLQVGLGYGGPKCGRLPTQFIRLANEEISAFIAAPSTEGVRFGPAN